MNHAQLFDQAIRLTGAQLATLNVPPGAEYPVRISELVKLNYKAVVLAWNDIQPDASDVAGKSR